MKLLWPWALVSLVPVVAAAVVALRRPLHHTVRVGTLRLWTKALAALGGSAVRRGPGIPGGWIALMGGAILCAVAMSRPVWRSAAPARRITIAICPAAELAGNERSIADFARPLLSRLDPQDRLRLVLPTVMGGARPYLSGQEVARRIADLQPVPVAAKDLSLPAVTPDQHLYRLVPATVALPDGPNVTTVSLPGHPGDVTIDAFAAEAVQGSDVAEVLAAVRNHTNAPQAGTLVLRGDDQPPVRLDYSVGPFGREVILTETPHAQAFRLAIAEAAGPGSRAYLAGRRRRAAKVAVIGRDDPLLRRFLRVSPALELAADAAGADAVIAVGVAPPPGRPALVINPPAAPGRWEPGTLRNDLALRDAAAIPDHPILAHVNLSGVAVRQARPWRRSGGATGEAVLSIAGEALVLVGDAPRRVYVAFDTAAENTNFPLTESYVIFLANVLKYLLPEAQAVSTYESITPVQAGSSEDWVAVDPLRRGPDASGHRLAEPGLYRDRAGTIQAVSLTGLRSARPSRNPAEVLAEAPLPDGLPVETDVELWWWLLAGAAGLWILGWTLRLR